MRGAESEATCNGSITRTAYSEPVCIDMIQLDASSAVQAVMAAALLAVTAVMAKAGVACCARTVPGGTSAYSDSSFLTTAWNWYQKQATTTVGGVDLPCGVLSSCTTTMDSRMSSTVTTLLQAVQLRERSSKLTSGRRA